MPESRRSNLRWYVLAGIMTLAGVALGVIWSGVFDMRVDERWFDTYLIGILLVGLFGLWILALSGLRWYFRLLVVALLLMGLCGGMMGLIADLRFDGDFRTVVRWRWEPNPEDVLEEHRRQQEGIAPSAAYDLTRVKPTDWPEYRGAKRDGVIHDQKLSRDWKAQPPKLLWKQPCGLGWASFAVVGDFAVTIEQRKANEVVVAYDVPSGKEIWKYEHPTRFDEPLGGVGPRATPTIAHGDVFSLGAAGHLACLDGTTGKPKWTKEILEGGINLDWAMAGSPLVVGDLVIVNPGNQRETKTWSAVVAYNRTNGNEVWKSGWTKAGYSSPMLATISGVEQVVLLDGKQVAGFDLKDGKELWQYPWAETQQDINVAQPLVFSDGRIFISSGYGRGCAMVKPIKQDESWNVEEKFHLRNKPLRCKFTSPVAFGDYIYGLDEGILACIRASDGKLQWKDGRYGHGQVLRYEDMLIVSTERGDLVLVAADPKEHRELGRIKAITGQRCWNVPAVANGRILVRNSREMACFDLRSVTP